MLLRLPKLTRRRRSSFQFIDAGPLIDRELELVEPAVMWVESMIRTVESPACWAERYQNVNRNDLLEFLARCPRGRELPDATCVRVPQYTFWMRLRQQFDVPVEMAGSISLRVGQTEDMRKYLGQIGYGVFPPARGRHLAERSVRLLFPLARQHGMSELWITCNPENTASRRTCERLGGEMVEIVDLPKGHPLYERGERRKCRYRVGL